MSQIKCIVAIFDLCSSIVDNIHVVPTDACAVRSITDLARLQPDHDMIIHATDYKLVHLGSVNMGTGEIVPDYYVVCSVSDVVKNPDSAHVLAESEKMGAAVGV